MKQLFLLLLFVLSSNAFAIFDNCRMRAIDADPPRYINVCNTPEGQMRLEDYYRYLDNGLRTSLDFEVIDERSFLPESEYPSRAVEIDSARLSETLGRIADLGRVSDTEEMIRARENSNRIDRINERIREINAARERFIQERNAQMRERDAVIQEYQHRNRLGAQLRNPNPVVRVGAISLIAAQSSKKEFTGEFGQRHLALKNKFKAVRVEDIKSYKLVGSAGISFLRSEEEFEGGDKSFASDLLSISESLLDVGLGIAPGSSLVKDSYELIFGTSMVTGEELSELERGIALVGVGVGVVSFGSAGGVATTLLRSKKLAKLADHFWNVSAKFLKTSKDVFDKALDVGENVVEVAWKYIKNLTSDSMRDFGEFLGKTLKSEAGQSLLHEPFGEFVEKVAKGVGSKDGVDFVKGIPNLKYKGKGTWVSEAGLEYGLNRTHQNTLRHILKHSKPDLSKPVHSVFSTDIKNIPSVIDSAWLIKGKGLVQRNKNIRYDIPVKGVGTNGEDILTIIIKKGTDNEIVTAFPTK